MSHSLPIDLFIRRIRSTAFSDVTLFFFIEDEILFLLAEGKTFFTLVSVPSYFLCLEQNVAPFLGILPQVVPDLSPRAQT